mgnify:CR=1 FL=1
MTWSVYILKCSDKTLYTGITNNQILSIVVVFSFIIGLFLIFGYYTFSSKLKSQYLLKKNQFTSDDKYLAVITENGLWIRDEVNGTINIINADKINNNLLVNVSILPSYLSKYLSCVFI